MRRPARNRNGEATKFSGTGAGSPLVIGHHPILCWIGELIGSVVRRVVR